MSVHRCVDQPAGVEAGVVKLSLHKSTSLTATYKALPPWPNPQPPATSSSIHLLVVQPFHNLLTHSSVSESQCSHIPHCVGRQGPLMYEHVRKCGKTKLHCSEICVCDVCVCVCVSACALAPAYYMDTKAEVRAPWTPLNIFHVL